MNSPIQNQSKIAKEITLLRGAKRRLTTLQAPHLRPYEAQTESWKAGLAAMFHKHLPKDMQSSFKLDIKKPPLSYRKRPSKNSNLSQEQSPLKPLIYRKGMSPTPEILFRQPEKPTISRIMDRFDWSIVVSKPSSLDTKDEKPIISRNPDYREKAALHKKITKDKKKEQKTKVLDKPVPRPTSILTRLAQRIFKWCCYYYKLKQFCGRQARQRRTKTEHNFNSFQKLIDTTVRYYTKQLYYPLKYYRDLIRDYTNNPDRFYNNETLNLLSSLMNKLKCTGLPAELMKLLRDISLERGFLPVGLLTHFELKRVEVSSNFGHLMNVSPEISTMIIGHVMCCRIIIYRLLLSPWNIPSQKQLNLKKSKTTKTSSISPEELEDVMILKKDYPKYRILVEDVSSALYAVYVRHFYKILLGNGYLQTKRVLNRMSFHYPKPLSTCPEEFQKSTTKEEQQKYINIGILPTCNKTYYKKLLKVDDERVEDIRNGMVDWLMRIYYKILSLDS